MRAIPIGEAWQTTSKGLDWESIGDAQDTRSLRTEGQMAAARAEYSEP